MRCPDCGAEMIELFTSVYCPVCEEVTEELEIDDEDWGDEIGPFELPYDGYIVPMKAEIIDAWFDSVVKDWVARCTKRIYFIDIGSWKDEV